MSRTDKDAPWAVRLSRLPELRASHYGCKHDLRPAVVWSTRTREVPAGWAEVELYLLTCCRPARLVTRQQALAHACGPLDTLRRVRSDAARVDALPRRTVYRWVPAHTVTERVRTYVTRDCDIDAGHPGYGWAGRRCSWVPLHAWQAWNSLDTPGADDRARLYARPVRRAARQALMQARYTREHIELEDRSIWWD